MFSATLRRCADMRPAAAMAGVRMYGLPPRRRGVGTAHVGLRRVDSDEVSSVAGTKKRRRDLAMKVTAANEFVRRAVCATGRCARIKRSRVSQGWRPLEGGTAQPLLKLRGRDATVQTLDSQPR